jgi:hypothetical protein
MEKIWCSLLSSHNRIRWNLLLIRRYRSDRLTSRGIDQRVVKLQRDQLEVDLVDPLDRVDPFLLVEGLYLLNSS